MTYLGHMKGGVVILDEEVPLPDGMLVRIEPLDHQEDLESLRSGLLRLAGSVEGLPSDMAVNHDHYLHGTAPK